LLDETFESVIDWAEGQGREAFGHLMGVVESAVQLGTFAAGGVIAAGEFRAAQIVQFFDRFNSVKRPNGETRYWQPDLTAYRHPAVLPDESKPDTLGLHRHQDKTLLPLENKRYAVSENPLTGEHRIDHRPDPGLQTHAQTQQGRHLANRGRPTSELGPDHLASTYRAGHAALFRARTRSMLTISGTHENVLRKMHTNAGPLPPVLADTLKRFTIDQDIQTFIEQIGSDRPDLYLKADPVTSSNCSTPTVTGRKPKGCN
jgi:hypothetical protein